MRWKRFAFWFTFGTLAVFVLALAWLWTADLGVFKPQIERFVSEQTGREFRIDGDLHIDLAGHSSIIAEDLHFQNAEWADQPDMVSVRRAEVWFDLRSLFFGPLVIEILNIEGVDVQLLSPGDKQPNWILSDEERPVAEEAQLGVNILVKEGRIDDVRLVFESAERTRPLRLEVQSLTQSHRNDGMLDLEFDALLDERVVKLDGQVGTWEAVLNGREIQFDLEAVLDTFELTAQGYIDDIINPMRPELQFTATGPDIDHLTELLGLGDEGSGDISLAGSLQKTGDEELLIEVEGNIGQTDIRSFGTVSDLQNPRDIDLDLTASGPDLGRVLRFAGIHQVRETPFMLRIDMKTEGKTFTINESSIVFGEAQMDVSGRMPNFPSVDDAVFKLLIEGPDIARFRYVTGLPGAAEGPFSLGFTVDVTDEGVEVLQLDFETSLGEFRGNGHLGQPPEFYGSEFNFRVFSDSLGRMARAYGVADLPERPIEFAGAVGYVEGGIRSLRPVVATVDEVTVTADGFIALTRGVLGSDVDFDLKGPDLATLVAAFTTAEQIPMEAYDLNGRLEIRDDGYRFRRVTGSIGSSAVNLDGLLTRKRGLAGTRFDFELEGPELQEMIDSIGDLEVRAGPYELSGSILLEPDMLTVSDLDLDRPFGDARLDLGLGLPVSRKWIDFDLRARGEDVRSVLQGTGSFEAFEQAFSVDVRGKRRGDHWDIDKFDVGVGDARSTASGDIEFRDAKASTEFYYDLTIPSLARMGTIGGRQMHDQAFGIHAHVVGGGGVLTVDQLRASIGGSDVNGFVELRTGEVPELDIDVQSDAVIFAPLLEEAEFEYDPEPEFEDGRFVPDIPVPFDAMKKLNASIDIDITELQRGPLLMKDIEFDADLRDGVLEISNATFKARSGALLARARLEPVEDTGNVSLELVARQFALGMSELNLDLAMTGDLDINLESTGNDLRTLLGHASGEFFLNARGGRMVNNRFVQALYGDLLQEILSTINPFRQTDPYTDFECIVLPLQIDDGQVTGAPHSFISTNKIRIVTRSSVDLKTEEIQVAIRTTPQRAMSISAGELVNPYIQVVGTMAKPRLAVDETGVLISGGAAVATAGLSLLARGVWDRLSRSRDPCGQTSERAIKELGDRFPDLAIEGIDRIE
jgi:hypothetical protein